MTLTSALIWERMEAAALTLRRLPNPSGSGARGYGSSWPTVVREAKDAYGYHATRLRVVPSPTDIQNMDEALGWLSLISDPLDRRIVWMRAEGHRWRAVCHRVGLVRQTAHRRAIAAVLTIERSLAAKTRRGAGRKTDREG
ncbi:DUF6362 family protein [Paracoccus litorisediminis]|uniref:DUF6362 domain-containing protein n=1 Tax=Paracoccus litorisediminis TaxID=2006130 RepID=A0A844HSL3_9RHOB|nr:DUF6362 family protein [Paracoccus litorisediminis]MTH62149.1 hypothetical protein [Paracoccus litorisediminis]